MSRPPLPVVILVAFFAALLLAEGVFMTIAFSLEDDAIVSEE